MGNRLTQQSLAGTNSYTYDVANRLTSVDGVTYTWDAKGNLLSDGSSTYTYDHANRLKSVAQGSNTYTFAYNGLGDRLQQTVNSAPTNYSLDLNAGLTQVLGDGSNVYLYGLGRIGAQRSGGWSYHLPDVLSSVRQLADPSGAVSSARAYQPFGSTLTSAGTGTTAYGFTGEWTDGTALIYLRARYYGPTFGRFLTRDPFPGFVQNPTSLHPYAYGFNNPINFTDPSGRQGIGPVAGAGGGVVVTCFGIAFLIPEPFFIEEGICTLIGLGLVTATVLTLVTRDGQENLVDQCRLIWQYIVNRARALGGETAGEPAFPRPPQPTPQDPLTRINIPQDRLQHVLERHTPSGAQSAGKSVFNAGEDIVNLIRQAENVSPLRQPGGNFQRMVDAGRPIGIDRATGQPTSIYTVITNAAGDLVTAFPGVP